MAFATLTIDLQAKLAKFETDLNRAGNSMDALNKRVNSMASSFSRAFGAAGIGIGVAGLAALAKSGIDAADSLNDMSDRLGVSVKDLASFKLAAQLADTSLEGVGEGIAKLTRSIGESEAGNKRMADALKQLGISARDPKEAFFQLADGVQRVQDPAQRAALLTQVLGRNYQELIPLLNQGAEGLRRSARESESFAETMARLAPEAGKFNDQLDTLKFRAAGATAALLDDLVPAVNRLSLEFSEGIKQAGSFSEAIRLFGFGLSPFDAAGESLEKLGARFRVIDQQIRRAQERNDQNTIKRLQAEREDVLKQIKYLNALEAANKPRPDLDRPVTGQLPDLIVTPARAKASFDKTAMYLDDVERAMREAADELERFSKLREADQEVWDDYQATLALVTAQQDDYATAVEASRQQIIDMIDPSARLVRQLLDLDRFDGVLDPELLAAARLEINGQIDELRDMQPELEKVKSLSEEIGLTFTSAFEDAITSGENFSDVLQAIEQDIIKLLARKYVTDPLLSVVNGINFGSLFGFASGGVMTGSGPLPLKRYASGGIASTPQLALFGEGSTAEAYVPLPDGRRIPVAMQGGGNVQVIVNNNTSAQATTRERMDGGTRIIEVMIEQMDSTMASKIVKGGSATASALERTYGLNRASGAF